MKLFFKRLRDALLVLLGARKAYNPKTHFISRYSDKPRARKVKDNGKEAA